MLILVIKSFNNDKVLDDEKKNDINADKLSILILVFLYVLEGVLYGISTAIRIVLQDMKTPYHDQAKYSMVYWPYSMKLLIAPVFDVSLSSKIGKQKMWLFPIQILIGVTLMYIAPRIQGWLIDEETPQINKITTIFFFLITLSAIQDIIIDGWALNFFRKENVAYSALCNNCGRAFGIIIGFVILLLLESEKFCNKWLRIIDQQGGVISFKDFFYLWGIVFIIAAIVIALFKRERVDDNRFKINFIEVYRLAWKILNLETIKRFCFVIMTYEIGFAAIEAVAIPKFQEYGVDKDTIVLVELSLYPVEMFATYVIAKYVVGPKPLSLFMKTMPHRILVGIFSGLIVYNTPKYVSENGSASPYYYIVYELYCIFQKVLTMVMRLSILSFFSRVSDPSVSSTYMSILNTLFSLENSITKTSAIALVSLFTFKHCTNSLKLDHKKVLDECEVFVDGFFIEIILCTIFSISWLLSTKKFIKNLQARNTEDWHINKEAYILNSKKEKLLSKTPYDSSQK
ncbi:acetyl-coenzyme A transporter 1-like isoform X2 [Daktulosphaira vitifoliae]|uniref:acetyl-coenzyme A transporter 1-like isoform X2 n=1 Tax=Daktulosphaira vitifoliae TaxID=58002 RepID=UPI0021AA4EF7|nr:acetyl-coenzyme A transporter 1-like isoform X2 [Daktulosphaira vitifoliae]